MKVTVVPAQVTTVEDRVAGNLSFSQLILLAFPVFGGSLLYAVLPPFMGASLYKIVIVCVVAVLSAALAIRFKGKIVLFWLIVLLHYRLRPRIYVSNRNTATARADYPAVAIATEFSTQTGSEKPHAHKALIESEKVYLMETLNDPMHHLAIELTKKGGFNVRITEAKE